MLLTPTMRLFAALHLMASLSFLSASCHSSEEWTPPRDFPDKAVKLDVTLGEDLIIEALRENVQESLDKVHTELGGAAGPEDTEAWVNLREAGYVNCLLVAMGRGIAESVEIHLKEPVPHLAYLSDNVNAADHDPVQRWLESLDFPYEELDSRLVVAILQELAQIVAGSDRWYSTSILAPRDDLGSSAVVFRHEGIDHPRYGPGVRVSKIATVWPKERK